MTFVLLLLCLAVIPLAPDEKPYLGVSVNPTAQTIQIDGRTFDRGLVVTFVQPDSGAGRAGLRAGDIIGRDRGG